MSYKQCELCGELMPTSLAQYCHICNEFVLEKLRAENKKLRDALIKTNKVLHDLNYDDSSCFHKVTRIVEEALEDIK